MPVMTSSVAPVISTDATEPGAASPEKRTGA
jgi:hypothetical protein